MNKSLKLYAFYVNVYAFDAHDESTITLAAESLDAAWANVYEYTDGQYDREDIHLAGEYPITNVVYHRIVTEMN